jgi:hypothetical protein
MATKRPCPVKGGPISATDCGEQRGSKLECPSHCPYFPFGTEAYYLWLKIDGQWIRKLADYLDRKIGARAMRELIRKFTLRSENPDAEVESAFHGAVYYGLMRWRSPDGRTIAEIWEAEGWKGLNNDERVMMRFRRRSFVTIIEIQRILGDTAFPWDRLTGEPLIYASMTISATRPGDLLHGP